MALQSWLEDCAAARFCEPVPVAVLREAWLGLIDEKSLHQRFISGGVTFCTLMPMRALPYRVVCLVGMNDGDFPRRGHGADFDLLALPGFAQPGDRSRREDDRYLMLEAVLSARDHLHVSWVGRSVRDNSTQPPSVLVAQLRDYLKAAWKGLDLADLTVEHFLQPFSRRYFEEGRAHTHASEWRAAHAAHAGPARQDLPPYAAEQGALTLKDLSLFMSQPVKQFFGRRLGVWFRNKALAGADDEPFALDGLEEYKICELLLADSGPFEGLDAVPARLDAGIERLRREGRLPIGHASEKLRERWVAELAPVRRAWITLNQHFPHMQEKQRIALQCGAQAIEDWIDQIRSDGAEEVCLSLTPSRLLSGKRGVRPTRNNLHVDKLIPLFVRQLLASAEARPLTCYLVGRDCIVQLSSIGQASAREQLDALVALWRQGMDAPLPTACKTALARRRQGTERAKLTYDGPDIATADAIAEKDEPCLARLWGDYAELEAEPGHDDVCTRLYQPLLDWVANGVEVFPLDHAFHPVATA